ncbi:hypothetical protein ACFQY7_52015 [Actinomadura luteofluorescens]
MLRRPTPAAWLGAFALLLPLVLANRSMAAAPPPPRSSPRRPSRPAPWT